MNKMQLVKEFTNAIQDMKETKCNGTYYWILGRDENNNNWAIVLGYADGFEEDEADEYMDGTYRLCVKLAYQSNKSIMQCDYDIDWLMPYDEKSGFVDNTEQPIYLDIDIEETIDWLLNCYSNYKK